MNISQFIWEFFLYLARKGLDSHKCIRIRDRDCSCGFINEDDLITQLQGLVDDLEIQTVPMKEKITS